MRATQLVSVVGYKPTIASRPTDLPISSARTCRLIFMEAVRGKSFSQIKYPPTRLKSGRRRLRAEISSSNLSSKFLILLQPQHQDQALAPEFFFRPDVVRRKDRIFLHRKAVEHGLNILG